MSSNYLGAERLFQKTSRRVRTEPLWHRNSAYIGRQNSLFYLAIVLLFQCKSGTIRRDSDFFRFRKYTKKAKFTKTKIFEGFVFLDFFRIKKKDSEYAVYNSEYATHNSRIRHRKICTRHPPDRIRHARIRTWRISKNTIHAYCIIILHDTREGE